MTDTLLRGPLPAIGAVARWVRGHSVEGLPRARTSPAAALKWWSDEYLLQVEMASSRMRVPDGSFRRRLRSELSETIDMFAERGWFDNPRSYHGKPDAVVKDLSITPARSMSYDFEHVTFTSTYKPWKGEPGADRWSQYKPIQTGHCYMMRHHGRPRPWMVLVNGYRTGNPAIDFASFRAKHLHEHHGLNVITVVLPLHGPRAIGRSGSRVLHAGALNTIHTLAHGTWDIRKIINWLRVEHDAPSVGISGISLGGYMASMVAGLEDGLACVIAGVPESDLVRGLRRQMAPLLPPFYEQWGLSWDSLGQALGVVSPLSFDCKVPHDRRYIYAGLLDRWVRPGNVHTLWKHWDEPSIHWYQGSHMSFVFEKSVHRYVDDAVEESFGKF